MTNRRKKGNGKRIAVICAAIFLIMVLVTFVSVYFVRFTNPTNTPADRISQGIVPTEADLSRAKVYDRVVIFGVDGAGGMFDRCDTPNFDAIFANGSVNLQGMAQYPTISAPNWGSMLLGVTAQSHNITNDKAKLFANNGKKYPSVFGIYAKAHPGSTFFSCVTWAAINKGIIENKIPGMTKVYGKDLTDGDSFAIDRAVAEKVVERLQTHDDKIVFMHFDSVDHAGHDFGNRSEEYKEAIERTDECLGIVYNGYKAQNKTDGTLFICVTDHGHTIEGGHGEESVSEKTTTLAVAGNKGDIIQGSSGAYVTQDLASIILYALGTPQPAHFEGGVPTNLFNTLHPAK